MRLRIEDNGKVANRHDFDVREVLSPCTVQVFRRTENALELIIQQSRLKKDGKLQDG